MVPKHSRPPLRCEACKATLSGRIVEDLTAAAPNSEASIYCPACRSLIEVERPPLRP